MEIKIKKKNLKKITASAELLLTHLRVKQLCLEEQAVQNYRNRFVELRTWYREPECTWDSGEKAKKEDWSVHRLNEQQRLECIWCSPGHLYQSLPLPATLWSILFSSTCSQKTILVALHLKKTLSTYHSFSV